MGLIAVAEGQIDEILKMAEENRYGIDILTDIAVQSILNKINKEIIYAYMAAVGL